MEESWKLGDLKADGSVTPKLFFDKKQRQSQAVEWAYLAKGMIVW